MPKARRKGKLGRVEETTSDEDSLENGSVYSLQSDARSLVGDEADDDLGLLKLNEQLEERFMEALDGASQKSAAGRAKSLDSICDILLKRYMPDFVAERQMTITDLIERAIKKGRGSEQAAGARIVPLLCIQLGGGENLCRDLNPILTTTALDPAVPCDTRAKCCTALGLLNFLAGGDLGDILNLMKSLELIFSNSYLKGDGSVSSISVEAGFLHAAALCAWGLLLTLIPSGDVVAFMEGGQHRLPSIKSLAGLLQSPHLEIRLIAGECIALVLEKGRGHREEFLDGYLCELIDATKQLATDSHKYRAKRDRKTQRATFRDILRYLEEDNPPDTQVRFGNETLLLDSWTLHHQYNAICSTLGTGLNLHLAENDFVREIFELGPRLEPLSANISKQTKLERHLMNAAAFKARTISRSKNRDKRSAVVSC